MKLLHFTTAVAACLTMAACAHSNSNWNTRPSSDSGLCAYWKQAGTEGIKSIRIQTDFTLSTTRKRRSNLWFGTNFDDGRHR